eukprot:CCRYP_003333-RA/>CCRYP_003333-RA protein AED:0.33 eAED:0.33 QI:54/1/1/1/0/0/2/190/113
MLSSKTLALSIGNSPGDSLTAQAIDVEVDIEAFIVVAGKIMVVASIQDRVDNGNGRDGNVTQMDAQRASAGHASGRECFMWATERKDCSARGRTVGAWVGCTEAMPVGMNAGK